MHKSSLVHVITGLQRGGAETILVTLCAELAADYQQSVFYFRDGPLQSELTKLGIVTRRVNYLTLFFALLACKPHVVHSSLWSANLLARFYAQLLGIPVYCALHTVAEHSGRVRNFLDRLAPVKPTGYIAVSQNVKQSYSFLPAEITVIENGVALRSLARNRGKPPKPYEALAKYGSPSSVIGAVGRFVPVKNFHILLDAFALLHQEYPHTQLMLIGHGLLETELRAQVKELALEDAVIFVINQPAHDYYAQSDIFVQPSAHEGLSIALLEAMQAGKPVIVSGVNRQHAVVVHGQSGTVITPTVQQLHTALRAYIDNPQLADAHADAGQQLVREHFSAHAMAQKYHQLFKQEQL